MQPNPCSTVDQVRALLVDPIFPAALTAAGLATPVFYSSPGRSNAPDVYLSVHASGNVTRTIATVPYTQIRESYSLPVVASVKVADLTPAGQQAATETAWAQLRVLEQALIVPRASQPWTLGIDGLAAYFARFADADYLDEAQGRVAVVVGYLDITANTRPAAL